MEVFLNGTSYNQSIKRISFNPVEKSKSIIYTVLVSCAMISLQHCQLLLNPTPFCLFAEALLQPF